MTLSAAANIIVPRLPVPYLQQPAQINVITPTAYRLPPTAFCLPPTAYCLLPTAYCLLPTAYRLLPTAYSLAVAGVARLCVQYGAVPSER